MNKIEIYDSARLKIQVDHYWKSTLRGLSLPGYLTRKIVTSYEPYACVTVKFEQMNRSGSDLTVFISSGESRRPPCVSVLQSHCQHHHCEHHQGTQSQSHGHRGNIRYEHTPIKPHRRILNMLWSYSFSSAGRIWH